MKFRDIKDTEHHYKGYTIIGTTYMSEGGWVLGGRHYVEGAPKRNYNVTKDGKYIFKPGCIIAQLKHAKEEIDDYINRNLNKII